MRLENKTALITGASRNIGAEIARTFAREGADLILNTLQSADELEAVAGECRELGVRTHTVIGDVGDPNRVADMVAEGIQALGKVDVLVSNVAVRPHKPLLEVSVEEWQDVIATNLHAAFYLIRGVLPGMIERGSGSIIGLGGQAAITGRPETAMVTTAKHGLLGLIRAVAAECAQYGVTVQTCGDLRAFRPLAEGQPSTECPKQTVAVPSNVNSYSTVCGPIWSTQAPPTPAALTRNGILSFRMLRAALTNTCRASRWGVRPRCRTSPTRACSTPATNRPTSPATA